MSSNAAASAVGEPKVRPLPPDITADEIVIPVPTASSGAAEQSIPYSRSSLAAAIRAGPDSVERDKGEYSQMRASVNGARSNVRSRVWTLRRNVRSQVGLVAEPLTVGAKMAKLRVALLLERAPATLHGC